MSLLRAATLLVGTVLIIGICYAVAAPVPTPPPQSAATVVRQQTQRERIKDDCVIRAESLRQRSSSAWRIRIVAPFVLAGDLSLTDLDHLFAATIRPTVEALQLDYFDHDPAQPIAIVVLSSDENYRAALERFGLQRQAEYSGLYHREERIVFLNLSTGAGTLAHELTHALAHADFPDMPEWFDEGLASLHEESEFSVDGRRLFGRDNWRRRFLTEAEERHCWKSVTQLVEQPFGHRDVAAVDYALARYVCLYLQEQGLLSAYYRKCRHAGGDDPSGQIALQKVCAGRTLAEIDHDFRRWLRRD